jgi:hypothetical protein
MRIALLGIGLPVATLLAAEADLSLDEQQNLLRGELREQFGMDEQGCTRFYLYETFSDYVIARGPEDKLFRIPYTISGDEITFGDAQEVTTAYVPVAAECEFVAAEAESEQQSGRYQIVAIRAGWASGGINGQRVPHYYTPEVVKQVSEAVHGKPFGRRHPDMLGADPTGAADPDRIAGWMEGGAFDGTQAITTVNLFSAEADLRSKLDDARKAGRLNLFGTSALMNVRFKAGRVEGKDCLVSESLDTLFSVDLCARGGAGGKFLVANSDVASTLSAAQKSAVVTESTAIAPNRHNRGGAPGATEGAPMKKSILQLLEALRQKNAARCAELSLKFANVAEADYPGFLDTVTAALSETATVTLTASEAAATQLAEAHRIQSRNRIDTSLTASKLSKPAQDLARTHLEAVLASESDLPQAKIDAEISSVRDAFAAYENVGRVHGPARIGLETADKLTLAMEAAMGVKEAMGKGVPAFRGLARCVHADHGRLGPGEALELAWGFTGHALASEAVATGDFPNLLLNSMTKRLLQDYAELSIDGIDMLYTGGEASEISSTQDRVREGYFGELSSVAEAGVYTEIAKPTDERVKYTVSKKGNLLTISEETIRNDDLGAIARFPGRLARAGRFTLKNFDHERSSRTIRTTARTLWHGSTHRTRTLALPRSRRTR